VPLPWQSAAELLHRQPAAAEFLLVHGRLISAQLQDLSTEPQRISSPPRLSCWVSSRRGADKVDKLPIKSALKAH